MIAELENSTAKEVFRYFEEISRIPRPSYHEEKISAYLVEFAKAHGLEYYQDDLYNVIMIKEATPGYEKEPPIILQGHMDMVCEKEAGVEKDMMTEGVDLYVDGDFLKAKGTTLGGDDGVAVAFSLALLDDDKLQHPRLEVVITVSEEVGMDGAREIDLSMLKGKQLLNLDSEGEGSVLASCAGGGTAKLHFPVEREARGAEGENPAADGPTGTVNGPAPRTAEEEKGFLRKKIIVDHCVGGHSGDEINKGRANATHLLNEVLMRCLSIDSFRLVSIEGGGKDNAIPRSSEAVVSIKKEDEDALEEMVKAAQEDAKIVYAVPDPDIRITAVKLSRDTGAAEGTGNPAETFSPDDVHPFAKETTERLVTFLASLPNGIQRMSDHIPGLVETSLNLGITHTSRDEVLLGISLRSSVAASYQALRKKIEVVAKAFGADIDFHGEYPAWQFVERSAFRDRIQRIYQEQTGKELAVEAIHAGLECGLLSGKIKGLDAVSMGPDLFDIHTPKERLSISSTERTWRFVRAIIQGKE